jgi:hypothetical protein
MCWLYGKTAMTFIIRFKQQKYLDIRKWQIINFENDVTLVIIASCDKRSFLTRNGLLLQNDMRKEISGIREMMKVELELEREKRRQELLAMRVSPPTQVQI